jgi:chemotaxis protein CheC
MSDHKMTEKQIDALQEAGNIGAAYAATALSKLVDGDVMIDVTRCKLINVKEFSTALGDENKFVVGINMLIPTNNLCSILMFLPYNSAMEYCDLFYKNELGTTKEIAYKEYVILAELGTICLCSYMNALSKLVYLDCIPTPPAVACDVIGSILEDVSVSADAINDAAIIIETDFVNKATNNQGLFLFIPDRELKDAIFKKFKVKET